MSRRMFILVNVLTAAVVMVAVVLYAINDNRENMEQQIAALDDETSALERVMSNYMLSEQRICNNWSHYINSQGMTMEEAVAYVRLVKPSEGSAHIVYVDDGTFSGLSSNAPEGSPSLNSVSYAHTDVLETLTSSEPGDDNVNLSRAFTNPVDGELSVAFCHAVSLRDPATGGLRDAVLMRVVPASSLDLEWEYMASKYDGVHVALADSKGDFIFRSENVRGTSFFDAVEAESDDSGAAAEAQQRFASLEEGHVMVNTRDRGDVIVSFAPMRAEEDRVILASVPVASLRSSGFTAAFIALVSVGLALILVVGFVSQSRYVRRLQGAEDTASRAVNARDGFLMTMSRDFRVPLNTLMGVAALADSKKDDPEVLGDCLRKIGLHSEYLSTMLNDILDMFRIEEGELVMRPAPFSIVDSSTTLVNMSQAMIREKGIDFSFHVDQPECETFNADQVRFNQVLINLLSSALKFCGQGGTVHVSLAERLGRTPATVVIVYSVSYTGGTVPIGALQDLDDPFARDKAANLDSDTQGAIIGLAVTERIAELLGGRISIEGADGQPTTLTATLELQRADSGAAHEIALPSVRVLVVDENADLRLTAKETLQSLGAVVGTAASGMEALDVLRDESDEAERYDVVILGRRMHGVDGIHTAAMLREQLLEPQPKLLVSAYDWTDLRETAREAGVDGFIRKPLFRSTLYTNIASVLGMEVALPNESDDADLAGMHALVVEDNDINWAVVQALLEPYGITCERAENGQIALDRMTAARDGEIGMVFMDVRMPVMNGLEATRAIRSLPTTNAQVPIIAMTAEVNASDVEACEQAGMNGHVAKPIDIAHLLQEMRKVRAAKNAHAGVGTGA